MSIDSANAGKKHKGGFKDSGIVIIEALALALFINVFLFQPFVIPSGSMRPTLYVGDYVLTAKYAYGYSRYSVPHYLPVSSILPSGRIWSAQPRRGDIIVFRNPSNPNLDFIKRVIGLPGDTVQMRQGALYINGKAVPRQLIGKTRNVDAIGCIPPDWSKGESFAPAAPDSASAVRCPGQRLFDPAQDQPVSVYRETLPNGVSYNTFDIYPMSPWDNTRVYEVPAGHYFMMGDNRDNSDDSRDQVGFVPFENLVGRANLMFFSIDDGIAAWKIWQWPVHVRWGRLFNFVWNIQDVPER